MCYLNVSTPHDKYNYYICILNNHLKRNKLKGLGVPQCGGPEFNLNIIKKKMKERKEEGNEGRKKGRKKEEKRGGTIYQYSSTLCIAEDTLTANSMF